MPQLEINNGSLAVAWDEHGNICMTLASGVANEQDVAKEQGDQKDGDERPWTLTVAQAEELVVALTKLIESDPGWAVWRQGDDGNPFIVKDSLTMPEADQLIGTYEARKHKQTYWKARMKPVGSVD